jgi:LysM repeat protein
MRRIFLLMWITIILFGLSFSFWLDLETAHAKAGTAADLIAEVNAVRTGQGLPALQVDAILMSTAQANADRMAGSGTCVHLGNTIETVSSAGYGGGAPVRAIENIACGYELSAGDAVSTYWTDATHMAPMTNPDYIHVGAGVSESGEQVYYVIQVAYTTGAVAGAAPVPQPGSQAQSTEDLIQVLITATPGEDGSIVHEVQSGQTLWDIATAYGTTVDALIALNQLEAEPVIAIGQQIIIQTASTPTVSPTITQTPEPGTSTPTLTPIPVTPTLTHTATLTVTPTPEPAIVFDPPEWLSQNVIGIGLIAVSALGMIFMVLGALRKR